MKPRMKGALLLLLAFGLGAAAGGLGYRGYLDRAAGWRKADRAERMEQVTLRRLTRELNLTADQQGRVEGLLRESGEEFRRLRGEITPRFRELRVRTEGRIRELLDAGQRAKFEEQVKRWEQRIERHRSREAEPAGVAPHRP